MSPTDYADCGSSNLWEATTTPCAVVCDWGGVGNKLGSGDLTLKLHYEGQPLVATKEQSYIESDQRIKEVWLNLADTDMNVRSKIKGISQGG